MFISLKSFPPEFNEFNAIATLASQWTSVKLIVGLQSAKVMKNERVQVLCSY